jgi:outer membrane protein TolC
MRPILVATLVMCTLTACKMGPDYSRPETSPGDSWRLAPGTSIANLPWWELLKDPVLHQLIAWRFNRTRMCASPRRPFESFTRN